MAPCGFHKSSDGKHALGSRHCRSVMHNRERQRSTCKHSQLVGINDASKLLRSQRCKSRRILFHVSNFQEETDCGTIEECSGPVPSAKCRDLRSWWACLWRAPGFRRIQMALLMTSPSGSTHGPSMLASNSSPWKSPQGGGVVGAPAARGGGGQHGDAPSAGGATEGPGNGRRRMHAEPARCDFGNRRQTGAS